MAATYNWFALLGGSHFLQQLGQACNYTVVGLVFIYAVDNIALLIPFVLVMTIGSIVSQPAWLVVSRRIGKRPTYVMCVIVWALVNLSWLLVHPATDELFRLPLFGAVSTQTILIMLRAVFIGPFNAGFVLMSYSLLTDTIEYDRRRFGISREGAFSGIYSALEKLAFAVGPAVAGVILSLTGFSESKGGEAIQSSGAIHGILIVFGFVPTFFAMSSLLLLRLYKLDERTILATRPA
jgi:GPH family glycoside/pentoside/hexuronide:cation symporter